MHLICLQEKFKKAINSIEKITTKQSSLPILKNILIELNKGNLIFSATNLEIGIIYKIGVKIKKEGEKIIVPAKILTDFINNIPKNDKIEINVINNILKIKSGKYKAKINCMIADDFPIIPECTEEESQLSINSETLKNNFIKNITSINNNDVRVEFTGININLDDDKAYFASTDTFRLIECTSDIIKNDNYDEIDKQSIIIPIDTAREIIRIINDNNSDITKITLKDNQIFFNINDIKIVSRIINGKYPNYKQIIPDNFKTEILLNKNDFLQAVKISSIFTNINNSKIKIKITREKMILKAILQEMGENEIEININNDNNNKQEIVINPRFLIDSLSIINEDNIKLSLNDNISPIRIKILNKNNEVDDNYINIIMPIRE